MTKRFFNSLGQILKNEGINPAIGISRHLLWQARRFFHAFPCELTISDSRLLAEKATGVAALVNAMGLYDFHNMSLLKIILASMPATFIDVGANIGSYTLVASESKSAFVVSIEPHPATFATLTQNVKRNGRENVVCLNIALSDHDGDAELTNKADSSINRVTEHADACEGCVPVRCRTLDSLCEELNVQPAVVKIDVEGHEARVIAGSRKCLRGASLFLIEGGERPEIRSAMGSYDLLGPLYFHQGEMVLSRSPQRRPEDPIYLSKPCLKALCLLGVNSADNIAKAGGQLRP